jgi:hypothetical protein
MDSSPRQPDKSTGPGVAPRFIEGESLKEAAERRRQQLLSMATTQLSATPSWGEHLLPILLAAMEACWVDAILIGLAGIGLFQSHDPILPLWAPFVLIAGSHWLANYLERRDARNVVGTLSGGQVSHHRRELKDQGNRKGRPYPIRIGLPSQRRVGAGLAPALGVARSVAPGTSLVIALIAVVTLFIIWLRIYAQSWFVLDPRWFLSLLNDILLLDMNAYLLVTIVGLCLYFCWRGIRLARREVEPAHVLNILRLGLVIIVVVVLVQAGQESAGMVFHDQPILFLLVPLFLILSLAAHALARAALVRRSHPIGLEGNVATQERSLILIIAAFGLLILLVTVVVGSVAVPSFLKEIQGPLGVAYDWLVNVIAYAIVLLVTPLFWLVSWFEANHPHRIAPIHFPKGGVSRFSHPKPSTALDSFFIILIPMLKVVLPIAFILLMLLLIRWALRRRRVQLVAKRRDEEVRESLWSWSLFWTQLKAFLHAPLLLIWRFFFRRPAEVEDQAALENIEGGPTARSIREIYRMLLKRAAGRGYAREKDETPYEFEQRLNEKTPLAEPRLEVITEAYTTTRYGSIEPDESEVARIRGAWAEVEQKWIQK